MKTLFTIFTLLLIHTPIIAQQLPSGSSIAIELRNKISLDQNLIGLERVDICIINKTNTEVLINTTNNMLFEADIDDNKPTLFYELNAVFSSSGSELIQPNDSIKFSANLNLMNLYENYKIFTNKNLLEHTQKSIKIRAGILCQTDKMMIYSEAFLINLHPLTNQNQEAFDFITKNGGNPFLFTSKGDIMVYGLDKDLVNLIISQYPETAFAELANLSLAYRSVRNNKSQKPDQAKMLQFLEKPLRSKYSFVRYLAEELKKNQ